MYVIGAYDEMKFCNCVIGTCLNGQIILHSA